MAEIFCCRHCRVEIEPIELADGTAARICVDCDLISLAHEVARHGPLWSAGVGVKRKRRAIQLTEFQRE